MLSFKKPLEFEWNKGNIEKNKKHNVTDQETEEVFFDKKKITYRDKLHSIIEERLIVIGKTKEGRLLYIICTIRKKKIRIISARNINRKEVYIYEKTTQATKIQK